MKNLTIAKEQQYTLFTPETETLEYETLNEIQILAIADLESGQLNYVINLANVKDFNVSLYSKLGEINQVILKENGILVVASLKSADHGLLKYHDIIYTKTLSEACDYIFMEEIEKGFLGDDEEE
jgi:hypothetical protein